ncbi:MAG: hypothetical protein WA919_08115 [Coleofasciculaceae cyanobacterium]
MDKIIIGIHGLANKSPQDILESWWKQSLLEGLEKNCQIPHLSINFQLVYWADLLYKHSLHSDPNFNFDSQYNTEPYTPARSGALKKYKDSFLDNLRRDALSLAGQAIDALNVDLSLDSLTSLSLKKAKLVRDLQFYYDKNRQIADRLGQRQLAKTVLKDELKKVLLKLKGYQIMLIAHSMGSIISYDVLRDLGQTEPTFTISHFVTIGSPLGIPYVKTQIIRERHYDPQVRTPSIVSQSWVNYADKRDQVAVDTHLADDYGANGRTIHVEDNLVANDYEIPSQPGVYNHHKSYGYLRTPELSKHVADFLIN